MILVDDDAIIGDQLIDDAETPADLRDIPGQDTRAEDEEVAEMPSPDEAQGDLAVIVGEGGITKEELAGYFTLVAMRQGLEVDQLPLEFRQKLLRHAIKLEIIFQAAIREGMLKDELVKKRIVGFYLLDKLEFGIEAYLKEATKKAEYEKLLKDLRSRIREGSDEEILLQAALLERYHRVVPIRQFLIFNYIQKHASSFDKVIDDLEPKARVKVFLDDLMSLKKHFGHLFLSQPKWNPLIWEWDAAQGKLEHSYVVAGYNEAKWWESVWAPEMAELKGLTESSVPEKEKEDKTEIQNKWSGN